MRIIFFLCIYINSKNPLSPNFGRKTDSKNVDEDVKKATDILDNKAVKTYLKGMEKLTSIHEHLPKEVDFILNHPRRNLFLIFEVLLLVFTFF